MCAEAMARLVWVAMEFLMERHMTVAETAEEMDRNATILALAPIVTIARILTTVDGVPATTCAT